MKNPLLAPELREYLAKNDIKELQNFCAADHPGIIADFLEGLTPQEIWQVLIHIEPALRAEIFNEFGVDVQI
ncbi:MAG: hypothetical protein ACE5JO_00955 [Candidatus Binatia bacterium]